jgi:hypothetical protein
MSFLLCLKPLANAFLACAGANYKFCVYMENHPVPLYKSYPEYPKLLDKMQMHQIKEEAQTFLEMQGIRKDLIICEKNNPGICQACGTNYFCESDAAVLIAPGLYAQDPGACHWLVKHEISHIKNNDNVTMPLIASICYTASAVLGTWVCPNLYTNLCFANSVGLICHALFCRLQEGRADDLATENSSPEELLGARRFFIAFQKSKFGNHPFWKFDPYHPSISTRLKKIEKALKEKEIFFEDNSVETLKIERLISIMNEAK